MTNPTNMSIYSCSIPKELDNYSTSRAFLSSIQPNPVKHGYTILNPSAVKNKLATDFNYIENCNPPVSCNKKQFMSMDPRLISVQHSGQVLSLDTPPITVDIPLDQISTDSSLDNYGQNYKDYSDVSAGQITYYIDKSQEDPFFLPNFATSANTKGYLYQDPMSSIKPQYTRQSLFENNRFKPTRSKFTGCLSSIEDSLSFREDLMARQMLKRNQQRYEPRYFSN